MTSMMTHRQLDVFIADAHAGTLREGKGEAVRLTAGQQKDAEDSFNASDILATSRLTSTPEIA